MIRTLRFLKLITTNSVRKIDILIKFDRLCEYILSDYAEGIKMYKATVVRPLCLGFSFVRTIKVIEKYIIYQQLFLLDHNKYFNICSKNITRLISFYGYTMFSYNTINSVLITFN